MLNSDDRELWSVARQSGRVSCVMVTCCNGAELQLRRNDEIVLRELYPLKADLYERAKMLEEECRSVADDPAVS